MLITLLTLTIIQQGSETGNGAAYSELSQFIYKKIPSHDTGQVNLNNPSLRLSFQVTVGCDKLTFKISHHNDQ